MAEAAKAIPKDLRRTTNGAFLKRYAGLVSERESWIPHWREIAENIIPRKQRFLYDTRNRGEKVNNKIINSTPTRAVRINSSGMMTGTCSPAKPWFRFTPTRPELLEDQDVREWLHEVEKIILRIFNRSNFYTAVPSVFRDIVTFGTASACMEEDARDVIRTYVYPIGSYALASSAFQEIDTLYHEVGMTVGQIAEKFGLERASDRVKMAWTQNRHDEWVRLLHVIEPNETYDPSKLDHRGKKWRSVWVEMTATDPAGPPLSEGNGFNEFPGLCPRWEVTGEDVYGSSPGMDALGDVKALQLLERRKLNAIDKIVNPPMVGPTSLKTQKKSLLSGDVTYVDTTAGSQKFEPAVVVDSRIMFLKDEIQVHEERIMKTFYADLFLMLSDSNRTQPETAREVDEKHEEKMLQLGSVFQRFHDEFLDLAVNRTFSIAYRTGLLPEPPQSLQGAELMVEPISVMETLQKMLGVSGMLQFMGFVTAQAGLNDAVLDKVDFDKSVDEFADMVSLPPAIVVSGAALDAKRKAREQRQQMAALGAAADPALKAAKAAESLGNAGLPVGDVASGLAGQPLNAGYV